MWETLGPIRAEGAAQNIREGVAEPSASRPGEVKSSDAKGREVWRMGTGEKGEDHVNLDDGDACVEVFAGPPGRPFVDKQPEGGGVNNAMKDLECFFLRFFGM